MMKTPQNKNWTLSVNEYGQPYTQRGAWRITQMGVTDYVLTLAFQDRVHGRNTSLAALVAATDEFIEQECGGNASLSAVPEWL
jgi:hypothetical protein